MVLCEYTLTGPKYIDPEIDIYEESVDTLEDTISSMSYADVAQTEKVFFKMFSKMMGKISFKLRRSKTIKNLIWLDSVKVGKKTLDIEIQLFITSNFEEETILQQAKEHLIYMLMYTYIDLIDTDEWLLITTTKYQKVEFIYNHCLCNKEAYEKLLVFLMPKINDIAGSIFGDYLYDLDEILKFFMINGIIIK